MGYLNYEFFDEFKALDNLCRDIYGKSADNRLGVTLYLEDMDKMAYLGSLKVANWTADYHRLKSVRHIRNELAHSRNSMSVDICSQKDIDFVRSFKKRIMSQTDPISLLKKQTKRPRYSATSRQRRQPHNRSKGNNSGCLGIVISFLAALACLIAFLI